jgi:Bacteriophage T4-like portal protein (Gp20)
MLDESKLNPPPSPGRVGLVRQLSAKIASLLTAKDLTVYQQPASQRTSQTGAADTASMSIGHQAWRVAWDRRSIYFDLKEMAQNDPLISTALDVIADCTTGFEDTDADSFEWTMETENEKALKLLNDMKKRCELGPECWQMVHGFVQYGEEYRELVVDDQQIVRAFVSLPCYTVFPKVDARGNRTGGWEQKPEDFYQKAPIQFEEWQIIPFIYGVKRGHWGTGLMLPARRTWKRLVRIEDGMALARLVRSYDRLVHGVPVPQNAPLAQQMEFVREYRKNMLKRRGVDENGNILQRENPFQVETDIFVPQDGTNRGNVDLLESKNNQLQYIEDVLYHQATLISRTKVPAKYLNLTRKSGALTDGGMTAEDIQFARTLRQAQAVLRHGLVRMASYALAMQGYDADLIGVSVNLPKISTEDILKDAKIQFTEAQAAEIFSNILKDREVPWELVAEKYMGLSEDETAMLGKWVDVREKERAEIQKKMFELGPPSGALPKAARKPTKEAPRDPDSPALNTQEGVPALQLVQVLTNLEMAVANEMERQTNKNYRIGRAERLEQMKERVADVLLNV